MQASRATATVLPSADTWVVGLRLVAIGSLQVLLTLATLILVVRRLSGALEQPLPAGGLLLAGGLAATVAAGIRLLMPRDLASRLPAWARHSLEAWPTGALVVFALALSLPAAGITGLCLLWSAVVLEEIALGLAPRLMPFRWQKRATAGRAAERPATQPVAALVDDGQIEQQLTRRRTTGDGLCLHGWLRATFVAGQRTAVRHIAFCPPLAGVPKFEWRQTAGPNARVKVAQLLPHGVRLEFKLSEPAEDAVDLRIEFHTECG